MSFAKALMDDDFPVLTEAQRQSLLEALWRVVRKPITTAAFAEVDGALVPVPSDDEALWCRLLGLRDLLVAKQKAAWRELVVELAKVAEAYGGHAAASNWDSGRPTSFTRLVHAVLETAPPALRIHGAHRISLDEEAANWSALSQAVGRVLRELEEARAFECAWRNGRAADFGGAA